MYFYFLIIPSLVASLIVARWLRNTKETDAYLRELRDLRDHFVKRLLQVKTQVTLTPETCGDVDMVLRMIDFHVEAARDLNRPPKSRDYFRDTRYVADDVLTKALERAPETDDRRRKLGA